MIETCRCCTIIEIGSEVADWRGRDVESISYHLGCCSGSGDFLCSERKWHRISFHAWRFAFSNVFDLHGRTSVWRLGICNEKAHASHLASGAKFSSVQRGEGRILRNVWLEHHKVCRCPIEQRMSDFIKKLLVVFGVAGAVWAGIGGFVTWLQTGDEVQARCYVTQHGPKMFRFDPKCN